MGQVISLWLCRNGLAVHQLEAARRTHLQTHCQSCCHHSNATSDRHPAHVCGCRAAGNAEQDRVSQQIAHETLSFLQPPCAAGMARERHQPFEWSLLMRAFASWKVCKACWRPPANTFARCHAMEAIKQPYRGCLTDQTAKDPWCKMHEQENEYTQLHRTDRRRLLPDWYWLAPYGPLDTKADSHVDPQTIECLNYLKKQRLNHH